MSPARTPPLSGLTAPLPRRAMGATPTGSMQRARTSQCEFIVGGWMQIFYLQHVSFFRGMNGSARGALLFNSEGGRWSTRVNIKMVDKVLRR